MKDTIEEHIKIKIAISLRRLLVIKKNLSISKIEKSEIVKSYNDIALNADIRKATVSNSFNAITEPKAGTLILIIEAMGFKLQDFADIFYNLNEGDINNFKKSKR